MIAKNKSNIIWLYLAGLFLAGICIVLSISIGRDTSSGSDFNVFWTAGNNFMHHNPLYSGIGGARRFIYPPFAAWLFQAFAFSSLQVAAAWFGVVNFLLYFLALYLTRQVFALFIHDQKKLRISLLFAAILSFRYFWYHFHFIQLNITVYVLCLAGILFFIKGRESASVIFFVIATLIKVYPVFFLLWIVIRGPRKTVFLIAGFMVLLMAIPFISRGYDRGISDIKEYYVSFIQPFEHGHVEPQFHNHSLASAIYKIFQPSNEGDGYNYQVFKVSVLTTGLIYTCSFLLLFGMMIFMISRNRYLRLPVSLYELSVMFLAMLLLCGITWEYHLVTLLFVYATLFTMNPKSINAISRYLRVFFIICACILAIVGRDTVGDKLFHYMGGYDLLTFMMTGLLIFYFVMDIKTIPPSKSPKELI